MSAENVDVVARIQDALGTDDIVAALADRAAELERRATLATMVEPDVEEMIDAGDRVVSLVRQRGTTATGGVEIEQRAAAVWAFGMAGSIGSSSTWTRTPRCARRGSSPVSESGSRRRAPTGARRR
jgi:ketosteroid isomerase-like protein